MKQTFCSRPNSSLAFALLLLLVLVSGCIPSTQFTSSAGGCPTALVAGEKLLIGEAFGITPNRSYELYQMLDSQVKEAGIQPAYAVEQDMYLRVQGVKPETATDTSNLAKMQQMGYAYYLELAVGNQAAGLGYASVSAAEKREMQQYNVSPTQDNTKATVKFNLYSTQAKKLIYTLTTTTEISPVTLPKQDQANGHRGSTSVNLSSISMAVDKAFQKGTQKLFEDCKCCRE
ncbi:hypothetical protein [uncultured Pontibacter sp.]|uniref:hypothetical protein n=1 Tax=uncultured Pontibacter sp. TaxID=453356 RepID=UPI00261072E1|nr:hypothetical protein [uncultured Pontibacter sp.]